MECRSLNHNYKAIAEDLIETEPELEYIKNSRVRIAYLESTAAKKADADKFVLGECEKVQAKNQWAISYDFTITLFIPNLEGLSPDQLRLVIFHELLHVGIIQDPDGGESYKINKHDLEDFKIIVDRYGVNWNQPGGAA